jgi:hypothetical protein
MQDKTEQERLHRISLVAAAAFFDAYQEEPRYPVKGIDPPPKVRGFLQGLHTNSTHLLEEYKAARREIEKGPDGTRYGAREAYCVTQGIYPDSIYAPPVPKS